MAKSSFTIRAKAVKVGMYLMYKSSRIWKVIEAQHNNDLNNGDWQVMLFCKNREGGTNRIYLYGKEPIIAGDWDFIRKQWHYMADTGYTYTDLTERRIENPNERPREDYTKGGDYPY